jgi:hypothetical protein
MCCYCSCENSPLDVTITQSFCSPDVSITQSFCSPFVFVLFVFSDGWLQDRSGQWVKDENVEFDSDSDEPPPSAPSPPGDEED